MEIKPTHIGGQALIEGVMMRGKKIYTIAVRTPHNEIFTEDVPLNLKYRNKPLFKLPIFRGMIAFVDSLIVGTTALMKSADIAIEEDEEENEAKQKNGYVILSVLLSIVLMVGLFILLPVFLSGLIKNAFQFESPALLSALESIIKMSIFLAYMLVISKLPDIKRVYMYHGAEHKTINCYEHGEELTVDNVKKYTRLHKRCGTSFLLIVMVVSIFVFMFLKTEVIYLRVLTRLILIPFVAGISYEFIRWAGRSESNLARILSAPGLKLQHLTTIEPDDDQIEIAIAAMNGVIKSEAAD